MIASNTQKGCEACQRHGPIQRVLVNELHPVVKPWPLRVRAMDLIDKIHPPSSKGHSFIFVAIDYFTIWVEAQLMANVTQDGVIKFIQNQIIHRFGILETITTDQRTMFTGDRVMVFTQQFGIKLWHSTPYYAQANGQADAINKIIIELIKKNTEGKPRK